MSDHAATVVAEMPPVHPGNADVQFPRSASSETGLLMGFFEWFGSLGVFSWRVLRAAVTPPYEWRELIRQLDEVGSKSLPLVAMAGAPMGVLLSPEPPSPLSRFGAKSIFPATLVYS